MTKISCTARLLHNNPTKQLKVRNKISIKSKNRTDLKRDDKGRFIKNG